ncbi:unnamed protein product [Medioppia subpectinata]|uniref:Phospholipid scramblase n=1 Tax=Medioppia subpectinata TaxID=1979941 RepID=A0A7R9KLR0_9ACAR|nr:unnamed protein product [Medioppia subpectinata]CAG2105931.1 unnamed protein product [Medioppia subpectinata]
MPGGVAHPGHYGPPQPAQGEWISAPTAPVNCPPGLEYLTAIDQLLVHQKVELLEDTDCCTRNCCGPYRPFDMKILDNTQREIIHLYRPLRCSSCWCFCCLQRLEVMSPPGHVIGYVVQEWSILFPKYRIEDANGDTVLRIEGPFCTFSICGDVEFQVTSVDGKQQVGKITKQWSGLAREMFTDADNFGISFPLDLDVNIKAVLLGACFLIDFMFFEKSGNKENDRPGMF